MEPTKVIARIALHTGLAAVMTVLLSGLILRTARAAGVPEPDIFSHVPFLLHSVVAAVVGALIHRELRHREAFLAWLLPFAWLLMRFLAARQSGSVFTGDSGLPWEVFFGLERAEEVGTRLVRYFYVIPFFAAASYSLGAFLQHARVFSLSTHDNEQQPQDAAKASSGGTD